MDTKSFNTLLKRKKFLISDGATGTELIRMGALKKGISPEQLLLDDPDVYVKIHLSYYNAGSDYVVASTFGATRTKLAEWGLENKIEAVNSTAIRCVKKAIRSCKRKGLLCAASIGPTGRLLPPLGGSNMEELTSIYSEQIKIILKEGVDLFVIETMSDIREAKAAYIAIRDLCKVPVGVCLTFDANGRTLLNNTPQAFAVSFDNTDVSFIGVNCSVGPDSMEGILRDMGAYTSKPLIVNPNAGVADKHYCIKDFTSSLDKWIACGARVFGGCCGTSPEYISSLKKALSKQRPLKKVIENRATSISSGKSILSVGQAYPCAVVGERINPTNRKKMSEDLKAMNFESVIASAREQIKDGANVLDVNMGISGVDQGELVSKAFNLLSGAFDVPLCVDSSDAKVIERALRNYGGKLLINSTTADVKKATMIFKLAKKYGACVIGLAMDEKGIPAKAEERLKLAKRLKDTAKKVGLDARDLVIDALTLSLSSNQNDALETIKTLRLVREDLGLCTVLGVSNISYGLPERDNLNQFFLALAIDAGLNFAIINPSSEKMRSAVRSMAVINGHDVSATEYVKAYSAVKNEKELRPINDEDPISSLMSGILEGNEALAIIAATKAVEQGMQVMDVVNKGILPAIEIVGSDFRSGKCYLPQVVLSAQTVKKVFDSLNKDKGPGGEGAAKGPLVIMATVKGDIHDIGKNIVITLLETNGFAVEDLGKSVPAEDIVKKVKVLKPKAIGLSALMTTTMEEMDIVIKQLRAQGLDTPVVVGGAVVTQDFADSIGAIYAKDAVSGVDSFKELTREDDGK